MKDELHPLIGDFSKPVVPPPASAPRVAAEPPAGPTKEMLDAAEKELKEEAKAVEAELRPMATYEEQLKTIGVTKEEAAKIVDSVIMKGYWSEEIPLTKSIRIRLRTRNKRDIQRAQDHLENVRPMYDAHYQEQLWEQLAAASLEQFANDKFEHPTRATKAEDVEKMFEVRYMYIKSMAEPAYRLLQYKLAKFDEKIRIVLQEGAIENF